MNQSSQLLGFGTLFPEKQFFHADSNMDRSGYRGGQDNLSWALPDHTETIL